MKLVISEFTSPAELQPSFEINLCCDIGQTLGVVCPETDTRTAFATALYGKLPRVKGRLQVDDDLVINGEEDATTSTKVSLITLNDSLIESKSLWGKLTSSEYSSQSSEEAAVIKQLQVKKLSEQYPSLISTDDPLWRKIAIAIKNKTQLWVIDDCFSAYPNFVRVKLLEQFRNLIYQHQVYCIWLMDNCIDNVNVLDNLCVMQSGRVVQSGSPKALYDAPNCTFVAELFAPINVLKGEVLANKIRLNDAVASIEKLTAKQRDALLLYQDRPAKLLVRAKHLEAYPAQQSHLVVENNIFIEGSEYITVTDGNNLYTAKAAAKSVLCRGDKVTLTVLPHGFNLS